jgi:hypothetical protein
LEPWVQRWTERANCWEVEVAARSSDPLAARATLARSLGPCRCRLDAWPRCSCPCRFVDPCCTCRLCRCARCTPVPPARREGYCCSVSTQKWSVTGSFSATCRQSRVLAPGMCRSIWVKQKKREILEKKRTRTYCA